MLFQILKKKGKLRLRVNFAVMGTAGKYEYLRGRTIYVKGIRNQGVLWQVVGEIEEKINEVSNRNAESND